MKKLIAYSSVAHMGFVTLGIFTFTVYGFVGAMLQMLNHGITTGALFLMVGIIYERTHSRQIYDNAGLGQVPARLRGVLRPLRLSSFAFPGTNSFVGELYVLIGTFAKQQDRRVLRRGRRRGGRRLHAEAPQADRLGQGGQAGPGGPERSASTSTWCRWPSS